MGAHVGCMVGHIYFGFDYFILHRLREKFYRENLTNKFGKKVTNERQKYKIRKGFEPGTPGLKDINHKH